MTNDPIKQAFECLDETDVPAGPPEELMHATLNSILKHTNRVASHQPIRRTTLYVAVAAVIVIAFGFTVFTLRSSDKGSNQNESVIHDSTATHSATTATAFIEADKLNTGQTFLLPISGSPVCIDPATWPDDLLNINSSSEL